MANANYSKFKKDNQAIISSLPLFFAFNKEQLLEGMEKLGVTDKSQIVDIGGNGFMKREDVHLLKKANATMDKNQKEFLSTDDGLFSAFRYELGNHEFCITGDYEPALSALGMEYKELTQKQLEILKKAKTEYMKNCDC